MIYQLDNGLTVILKEVHSAPVVSSWLAYRVGSRDEHPGQTGITHWVEHMLFKGTAQYPQGMLDRLIDRVGGQWNGYTSHDFTVYFETLPANQIDLALSAEADRMTNALFDPQETESERTVIISELQGAENSPVFWLREAVRKAAYREHGYHHAILGELHDLKQMTRDDLYAHYQTHYIPSNAVLVLAGDFTCEAIRRKIDAHFGKIPFTPAPVITPRVEPPQTAERRVVVERPGNTAFLTLAFHAPPATHTDWFKLDMLDSILSGPGGDLDNKTSRLYQALVTSEICVNVGGGLNESIDPYLYGISATLRDGRHPQEAETVITQVIETIMHEGVTERELARAKKQARAAFAYETESVTDQAYWLIQSAILDDVNWFDNYIQRIDAVTVADIQAVARQYLLPERRVVGWLLPTDGLTV